MGHYRLILVVILVLPKRLCLKLQWTLQIFANDRILENGLSFVHPRIKMRTVKKQILEFINHPI